MCEMLGNQYFLARRYGDAIAVFEKVMEKNTGNKAVRRKLVICYAQTGQVRKAFDIFISLAEDDMDYIINTDPVGDDCPCPELVTHYEELLKTFTHDADLLLKLGMLWLYCNPDRSLYYFRKAKEEDAENGKIQHVLSLLLSHLSSKPSEHFTREITHSNKRRDMNEC